MNVKSVIVDIDLETTGAARRQPLLFPKARGRRSGAELEAVKPRLKAIVGISKRFPSVLCKVVGNFTSLFE